MKRQTTAYLYAITAVIFWSTAASAFKLTLRSIGFMDMLVGASATSFLFLGATVVLTGRYKLLAQFTSRQWVSSAVVGMLNPFLYYVLLFKAYSILSAQEALVLNYTWPIMLVLLSIPLLRQPMTLESMAAFFLCFGGIMTIGTGGHITDFRFTDTTGVALALFSAVVWALYWIYNVRDTRDEIVKLFLNFAFGTLFILGAWVFMPHGERLPAAGLFGAVYIGMFEMGLTFVLWLKGLKLSSSAAKVSVLVYLSPFLSLGLIQVLVGERIAPATITGLLLIVAGIGIHHVRNAVKRTV